MQFVIETHEETTGKCAEFIRDLIRRGNKIISHSIIQIPAIAFPFRLIVVCETN